MADAAATPERDGPFASAEVLPFRSINPPRQGRRRRDDRKPALRTHKTETLCREIRVLGLVGGPQALHRLAAMAPPRNAHVRRQWLFSRRLIAHRLGWADDELLPLCSLDRSATRGSPLTPLVLREVPHDRLQACRAVLAEQACGVSLAYDRGVCHRSVERQSDVVFAAGLSGRTGVNRLATVPMVAAAVVAWDRRTGQPALDQLVLTTPHRTGILVRGYRLDGTLMFDGDVTVRDGRADFAIASTSRSGACRFHITGALKEDGVTAQAVVPPRRRTTGAKPTLAGLF